MQIMGLLLLRDDALDKMEEILFSKGKALAPSSALLGTNSMLPSVGGAASMFLGNK
jgi:hypothetical protein